MIKVKSIFSFAALAVVVCLSCGCETLPQQGNYDKDATKDYVQIKKGGYADINPYTLRDFEVKGIVFVESKVNIDVNGERTGSEITNYMLMKEAQKLGADDIINVKIDEKEESKVVDTYDSKLNFLKRKYKKTSYMYQATALAIKYTNAIILDKDSMEKVINTQKEKSTKKDVEIKKSF